MAVQTYRKALRERLFSEDAEGVFAVVDGASAEGLIDKLYSDDEPEFVCLYRGELEPDLAYTAPYLVRLDPKNPFTDWLLEEGWGAHWAIFVQTDADLAAARQHFRRFMIVHDEEGKPLYFRYYDPRVLRTYLPTCTEEELDEMFGPVDRYLVEGEEPETMLSFEMMDGKLRQREAKIALADD